MAEENEEQNQTYLVLVNEKGKIIPIASQQSYNTFRVLKKQQAQRLMAYDQADLIAFGFGLALLHGEASETQNDPAFKSTEKCMQLWEEKYRDSTSLKFETIRKDFLRIPKNKWQITLDTEENLQCALENGFEYIPTDMLHDEIVAVIHQLRKSSNHVTKKMLANELTRRQKTCSTPHFECIVDAGTCEKEIAKMINTGTPPPTPMQTPVAARARRQLSVIEQQQMSGSLVRLGQSRARSHQALDRYAIQMYQALRHEQLQDAVYERRELEFQAGIEGPLTEEEHHQLQSGTTLFFETPARSGRDNLLESTIIDTSDSQEELANLTTKLESVTFDNTAATGGAGTKTSSKSTSPTLSLSSISSTTINSMTATATAMTTSPQQQPGWNGMFNNGMMCYMISLVQVMKTICLRNPDVLAGLTSQVDAKGVSNGLGYCLSQLMSLLVYGIDPAPINGSIMADFKVQVLQAYLPQFGNSESQHDVAEFFLKFVGNIYHEMMPTTIKQLVASDTEKAKMILQHPMESQPMKAFLSMDETTLLCPNCGQHRTTTQQCSFGVNLQFDECANGGHSIQGMLDNFFGREEIMMDDKYPCQCGHKIAFKFSRLLAYPRILSITILRFNNSAHKIFDSVHVADELVTPGGVYDLIAGATHHGDRIDQGHFTCDAIRPTDNGTDWFCFDDENVSPSAKIDGKIDLGSSYQLFYHAREDSHPSSSWEQAKAEAQACGKPLFVHVRNGFTCESQNFFFNEHMRDFLLQHFVLWQGEWWEAMDFNKKHLENQPLDEILPAVAIVDGNCDLLWCKSNNDNWQSSPQVLLEELKRRGNLADGP